MFDTILKKEIPVDPSRSSIREEMLDLELEGTEERYNLNGEHHRVEIYKDKKSGERFCKLNRHLEPSSLHASSQRLLSFILKGVINVADVVKVGNNYYSHEQKLRNIANKSENLHAEVNADIFIMRQVFMDRDHHYFPNRKTKKSDSGVDHKNLIVSEHTERFYFFDFNRPLISSMLFGRSFQNDDPVKLEQKFKEEIVKLSEEQNAGETIEIIRSKIKTLLDSFSDGKFEDFKIMLGRSGAELGDDLEKILFNKIQSRIKALNKVLSELEAKK